MRKRALFCLATLLLFLVLPLPVAANEDPAPDRWGDFLAGLPDEVRGEMPESGDADSLSDLIGVKSLFALLATGFSDGWRVVLPSFLSLFGLILLAACYELFRRGDVSPTRSPVSAALSVTLSLSVWRVAQSTLEGTVECLSSVSSVMTGFLPVMTAVSLSGGNAAAAVAESTGISAILSLVSLLFCRLLPSLAGCCYGLALVGTLVGEDLKLDGITGNLRGFFLFGSGILSTLLTGSLALSTGLAAASDGMAVKTAKTAISGMIPIVGGAVGTSLSAVAGSLSLLRHTLGVGAVYAILLLLLPTLVRLLLIRFSYSLSASVARTFSLSATERLLGEFRAVSDMLIASLAMGSVTCLLAIGVFLKCTTAVG